MKEGKRIEQGDTKERKQGNLDLIEAENIHLFVLIPLYFCIKNKVKVCGISKCMDLHWKHVVGHWKKILFVKMACNS